MIRFLRHALNAYQKEYPALAARPMTMAKNLNRLPDMSGFKALGAEERADVHVALLLAREFQQLRRQESEFLRDQDVGEHLHANVIQIDLVVVELPAVRDRLFQRDDPALQLLESFVGLELRIVLGDRK